jgi:hypothetical protein
MVIGAIGPSLAPKPPWPPGSLRRTAPALALAIFIAGVSTLSSSPTTLRLESRGCWGNVTLRATTVAGQAGGPPLVKQFQFKVPSEPPAEVALDLVPANTSDIQLEAAGCWAPPFRIAPQLGAEHLAVALWPAGSITGGLELASKDLPPASIEAALSPVPAPGVRPRAMLPPPGVVTCQVTDGRWSCRAPAGNLNVQFKVPSFAPVYLWDVDVPAMGQTDLGKITFVKGSSVAGWVAGQDQEGKTEVELRPEALESAQSPAGRQHTPTAATQCTGRGFFQLRQVPPGSYALIARRLGWSTRRVSPVLVRENEEVLLADTIVLDPLASLEVRVSPTQDASDLPWHVQLRKYLPLGTHLLTVAEGTVDAGGGWVATHLETGGYLLEVQDSQGNTHKRQRVDVQATSSAVEVALSSIPVRIRVRCGDQLLRGTLRLFRSDGPNLQIHSDPDGVYHAVIPLEGQWKTEFRPDTMKARLWLRPVQILPRPGGDASDLDLALTGLVLGGRVVDSDGRPTKGALVDIHRGKGFPECQLVTGDEGQFSVCGVEAGELLLRATTEDGDSGFIQYTHSETGSHSPLELVLKAKNSITLRLTSGGSGIPGCLVAFTDSNLGLYQTRRSDFSGTVTIRTAPGQQSLDIAVLHTDFPALLTRLMLGSGTDSVEIPMDLPGGTFEIAPPGGSVWVCHEGATMPVLAMLWQEGRGPPRGYDLSTGGVHLFVRAGTYVFCPSARPSAACVASVVPPNGRVSVVMRSKVE